MPIARIARDFPQRRGSAHARGSHLRSRLVAKPQRAPKVSRETCLSHARLYALDAFAGPTRDKMSRSRDASGPACPRKRGEGGRRSPRGPVARCGLPAPELQMISNRIARNIIRYVFHYPSEAPEIQIRLPLG